MNNDSVTFEETAKVAIPTPSRGSFAILIVDDESELATMLSEVLTSVGYSCESISSAVLALKRPDINSIKLIITDMRMPEMSGVEFAEALHERDAQAKIIFMTGQADIEMMSRAMNLRPFGYLNKPFGIFQLRDIAHQAFQVYCDESVHDQKFDRLTNEVQEQEREIEFRTERLMAEQTLMQGLIGNATFGLITVDNRLFTCLINDVAIGLLQLKPPPSATHIGTPINDLLPAECSKEIMGLCTSVLADGQLRETTFRNPLSDRLLSLASYPVRHRQTINATVIVIHDVTEKDVLQKQLLQTAKLASIGELAAGIAHEINNPLGFVTSNCNTLAGYVDAMITYLRKMEETIEQQVVPQVIQAYLTESKVSLDIPYIIGDIKPMVAETLDGLQRVSKIVADLKTFARLELDNPQLCQINTLIDDALNLVRNETKNNLDIQRKFSELPEILCFPTQLVQVFTNMFVNAAQAVSNQGTLIIRTAVKIDTIRIKIRDNGKGIPEKNLLRVFDPFFTTKPPGKGTGMGLSISFGIIQKHNGTITVQSELGKGTEFIITLPLNGLKVDASPKDEKITAGGI